MSSNSTVTCPAPMKATSNGVFQGENPLDYALPLAILQIILVVALTRFLALLLRPLRQPRVIAEIIGGILLGPSALGRFDGYLKTVFPARSLTVLDTLANLGLIFFLFMVGLELDLSALRATGKKALSIAVAGISLPFALGIGCSFVLRATISKGVSGVAFVVFMGVAMSITAFPVLARILAELKLLTTEVGRMAMSAAAVNDVAAWILLALAIALSGSSSSSLPTLWVFLSASGFLLACWLVIPRVFKWIAQRCAEGEPVEEVYICATLASVLAAGFVTDAIGIHALFGAFVIGVLIPKQGAFSTALVEKVEDLVSSLFLPLYFVSSGLKTNVATIDGVTSWVLLALVIFVACFGKIAGTVAVSVLCKIPFREAVTLGVLMNTKGLVELIVLNIGKDRKVLNDQTFAILVLMALFTTFITTPMVISVYRPVKRRCSSDYHRTVERDVSETTHPLRLLLCFHSMNNIPTMLNLIEASRGTEKDGLRLRHLCVYAMHLMELSERPSAIRMVHRARRNGLPFWNKTEPGSIGSNSNQVVVAFEAFHRLSRVQVKPMTAISAMANIHEDICASAENKRVAMIILPFHKHQRFDGVLETTRTEYRFVNRRVLENSPCSVGILVDRGLGGTSQVSASNVSSSITVVFFGGRDDREALSYASRMAEHPGISLVVIRFLFSNLKIDEDFLEGFRVQTAGERSVKYEERLVGGEPELVSVLRELNRTDLFVVGRMPEGEVLAEMRCHGDCPELGSVGSLLASSEFATSASVLVVQRYHCEIVLSSGTLPGSPSFPAEEISN